MYNLFNGLPIIKANVPLSIGLPNVDYGNGIIKEQTTPAAVGFPDTTLPAHNAAGSRCPLQSPRRYKDMWSQPRCRS